MDRDIKRDRELCEKATKGPWIVNPAEGDCNRFGSPCPRGLKYCDDKCPTCEDWIIYKGTDVSGPTMEEHGDYCYFAEVDARFIAESRTALPYYISLCEHLQRMVEAAITFIVELGECPPDGHKACRAIVTPIHEQPAEPPLDFCIQCIRDYLDAKAKEGEKSGN